jgi:uncharacterized protein
MALRVVLDTNVLVSALVFASPGAYWLRALWQRQHIVPLASRESIEELIRVLAYGKFALSESDQRDLLEDYLPFVETVVATKAKGMPACRDPNDEKFLRLAYAAKADALVTGDRDLLALARQSKLAIIDPAALKARLRD